MSSSSSTPKSKQRSWKLSAVNLEAVVSPTSWERKAGWWGSYLLFTQLLEEGILVDADGRHLECLLCNVASRTVLAGIELLLNAAAAGREW